MRSEIQALRGIAVALVVIAHLWPAILPGGFVGVDVFFVISGFLITSHLVREIDRRGRVDLAAFWARRARRILPAALTVLVLCGLATVAIVPETRWPQFLGEIRASALYVENWRLASSAVDYFAAGDAPSPVQHYWSLSVEEQFYLVWPLLLLAGRKALVYVIGGVALLGVAYSVQRTATDPAAAYFVTTTRVWEFAAGGLLALAPEQRPRPVVAALGLVAIAVAAVFYGSGTPFPGIAAALPVAGALAVILARAPITFRPLVFLGGISYSVYLWHWPLLILAPFATGAAVDTLTTLTVLMLSLLFGWITKLVVEDPARYVKLRSRWTFACAGAGSALVLAVTASGNERLQDHVRAAERASQTLIASAPTCFGAAARDPERPCSNPRLRLAVVPTPIEARKLRGAPCPKLELRGMVYVCGFGVDPKKANATIALVGDSHAAHWRGAMDKVARTRGWTGVSISHTGCPLSKATKNLPQPRRDECVEWNRQVLEWFERHPEVKTVFVSQISGGAGVVAPGRDQKAAQRAGYLAAWKALPASVERVVVLRDTPKALGDTDTCVQRELERKRRADLACRVARRTALTEDTAATAARTYRDDRADVVDLTRFMCDRAWCYPVIGGVLVLKDQNHLTETFATSLAPFLDREL